MTRLRQKRVVLNSDLEPLADKIIEQTGIPNCSQLFAILLTNYGEKLITALKGDKELVQ
ncbi:hypothetical protein [Scytonema sp. UIC 10036]|uniref:hypothetical protein n=1 Tax=Scytonema sp. UIC 10036 TaxID=2304196 RepID=UPI00140F9D87|nr:hypothetical protein [Scytonema sp. UIC 10036]